VYKQSGFPEWLQYPKLDTKVINYLSKGLQETHLYFYIEGRAPMHQEEKAKEISTQLRHILKNVQCRVDICA
jgi:hypothetical protein